MLSRERSAKKDAWQERNQRWRELLESDKSNREIAEAMGVGYNQVVVKRKQLREIGKCGSSR